MSVLIAIAFKSLLIGGLTLGLLQLMRQRSAAERSWVAHIGLLALMIMAIAPLFLPTWNVEAPSMLGRAETSMASQAPPAQPRFLTIAKASASASPTVMREVEATEASAPPATARPSLDPIAAVTAIYAIPAAILLCITLLALLRLVALQARAEVLVDGHWLSALARAQRRMGFKHGTALLTSNELASPISWGLMRPVILLNSRAVEATGEAEAIIAHELAHVARLDWIKLLLARVATALFWFNPLVWLLAREAHQLREEAADDTVLAADIPDTDYAQLLVGVARHECPGLLLGAHGVAPSKSSLARRIARVLDVKLARGPVARSFALGVFSGAMLVAAPLAALTLTPAAPKPASAPARFASQPQPMASAQADAVQADLPHIIAQGVKTSVSTAMAAVSPAARPVPVIRMASTDDGAVDDPDDTTVTHSADGSTLTLYPADSKGRRKMVAQAADGSSMVRMIYAPHLRIMRMDRGHMNGRSVDVAINAVGVTPEYIAAMRAAAPRLADASIEDINGMRVVGVSPEYAQALASAGLSTDAEDLMHAKTVGLSAGYVNAMRAVGVHGDLDDYIQLRAVGIDPSFAARARASGVRHLNADTLIEMNALAPPAPPTPPATHRKKERGEGSSEWNAPDADPNPDG